MKRLLTVFLLCMSTQLFADIVWQKDILTAFEMAKKENSVLMIFVEGEHCRWCKKMKHRTLADENVSERLKPYIAVKVMREDEEAVKDLPMIHGVPTIFFMTGNKKVLESVVGYFGVDDLLSYIDDVEKKVPLKNEY
jgi:thioredoxin-related protein